MTEQLKLAAAAYADSKTAPRDTRIRHAIKLGETGLFSLRQIASITGAPLHDVAEVVRKTDKAGGKLNPDALPLLIEASEAEDEADQRALIYSAYVYGASANAISALLGLKLSQVWHRIRRRKAEIEEEGDD